MARFLSCLLWGRTIAVAAALAATLFLEMYSFAEESTPQKSELAVAAVSRPERLFELRIYTAAPGKMDALHQRFRDHTLRLFEKHGIQSIGYWTGADEQNQNRLFYLVAYPDRASREKMLINGIAADPEFRRVVAESEQDGKLTTEIESVLLSPTDYSALK